MATDATGSPTPLGIPKFNTSVDAPSGLGSNAQMDSIDTLIAARIGKPSGIATGEVPVWNGTTFVRSSVTNITAATLAPGTNGQFLQTTGGVAVWGPGPTNGAGTQLDYAQVTADVSITHTTEGTADTVVTGNSITYDGTKNKVEFWCPNITSNGIAAAFVLLRDSTVLGQAVSNITATTNGAFKAEVFDTPTAAAHTYAVKAFQSSAGTLTVKAGAGGSGVLLPAFLRVTKA